MVSAGRQDHVGPIESWESHLPIIYLPDPCASETDPSSRCPSISTVLRPRGSPGDRRVRAELLGLRPESGGSLRCRPSGPVTADGTITRRQGIARLDGPKSAKEPRVQGWV